MRTASELNKLAQDDISQAREALEDEIRERQTRIMELQEEIDALRPIVSRLAGGIEGMQLLERLVF